MEKKKLSPRQKMERFRNRLKQGSGSEWEDFAMQVILVAHEMHWTLEYVMEMPPWMLNRTIWGLNKYYEQQKNQSESGVGGVKTLGG